MRPAFKNSIVSFLIANLLVSTIGVSLHTLYCYCRKVQVVSFFEIADPCGHTGNAGLSDACCKKSETAPTLSKKCCDPARPKKDCQKRSITYLSLDSEFLAAQESGVIFSSVAFLAPHPVFWWAGYFPKILLPQLPDCAPPPLAGRALVNFVQAFLC